MGTLIRGDSGAGKSEAALALIERGHSLVADDIVKVKLLSDHTPVGFCDEMFRGFMECRGIGIINVEELFGIRFVRLEKRIDLVVTFLEESNDREPDRTGLERKSFDILGIDVPHMEIPLRAGRDMARLVEVAAMVQAARQLGHDSANDFNENFKKNQSIGHKLILYIEKFCSKSPIIKTLSVRLHFFCFGNPKILKNLSTTLCE